MNNKEKMHEEKIKELEELTCRSFDPQEVMTSLIPIEDAQKGLKYLGWRVEHNIGVVDSVDGGAGGLMLKLNHKNYDDCIYITLSFLDFFNVYFVSTDFDVLHTIEDVPCDSLFDTINEQLEGVVKFPVRFSNN